MHLSYGGRLRVGVAHSGGDSSRETLEHLPVLEVGCKRAGEGRFTRAHSDRRREIGSKLKEL